MNFLKPSKNYFVITYSAYLKESPHINAKYWVSLGCNEYRKLCMDGKYAKVFISKKDAFQFCAFHFVPAEMKGFNIQVINTKKL